MRLWKIVYASSALSKPRRLNMEQVGFAPLTAQQIYQRYKVTPDDARSIAQALGLGREPFKDTVVEQIVEFAQAAKVQKLTIKQALSQVRQQAELISEPPSEPTMNDPGDGSPDGFNLPAHLRSLLNESANRAQAELNELDRVVFEQVELPAATAAVNRILAADQNIERLMLRLLGEAIAEQPGRLGGVVMQAIGQFRAPTLAGVEARYALPSRE
jgi:(2Fe-2S) ferredoxin